MTDFPDPGRTDDLRELLLTYLDFYRGVVTTKVSGLDEDAYTTSCVPSGWTVAGLVNHLIHMERRWLHWGFAGEPVDQPWADRAGDGWVSPDTDVEALLGELAIVGAHTRRTVEQHDQTSPRSAAVLPLLKPRPSFSGSCCTCCRSMPATPGTWTLVAN